MPLDVIFEGDGENSLEMCKLKAENSSQVKRRCIFGTAGQFKMEMV